ncbi:MAG: TetR/AcrR family transcriptional regulator [Nitrosomonas sp.]|jgi:AcrR family transcriptional regulator|nr:TetR/AcrR family transcriptional regulator [Nitrosomonas sp.]
MNQPKKKLTAKSQKTRQKIIDAAFELFYSQGYQSTTMDQVIEASGVSKPTVYIYFSSKEVLCVEYLKERHHREATSLTDAISQVDTPYQRYMSVVYWLRERLIASNYRGCGFFNMIAEIPDPENPIIVEAKRFVDNFRSKISALVIDLQQSDAKYQILDPQHIADAYYLILCGAIMASQEYRDTWPSDRAVQEIERLIQ